MKRIELLCDACIGPIMSGPIYVCANEEEHCNFVLHEWCSRLSSKLKGHPYRPQHTLVLHSKVPGEICGVFRCETCRFYCNGFAYCCKECEDYNIDVKCVFIPKEITHTSHPNHLLSRVYMKRHNYDCYICSKYMYLDYEFTCYVCDFHIHAMCALLLPETTTIKCDKHPMKLSYSPIENHGSEYFCEVCEEINPELSFYHCHECIQSMHTACAPSILLYDMHMSGDPRSIPYHVNVKFGGTYINFEMHPHPLSFVQGLESDGKCTNCLYSFKNGMIFKCINCGFAIDYWCLSYLAKRHKRL
ncbi:uncharacterized protein LOC143609844 [Bidens hawaiensis]|uniref:uncharacterized protein LOC143609844 n=1 Tax=Bidens hawaiensis TaxID=980011 RepID=UPI00404B0572